VLLEVATAVWMGTLDTEMTGRQPGATHITRATIELLLEERPQTDGTRRLIASSARYRAAVEMSGATRCTGTTDITVADPEVFWTLDRRGRYVATVPRAFGRACGHNTGTAGSRPAELGHGMDPEARTATSDRMRGSYNVTRESKDTYYSFKATWNVRRIN
jgi:hypothetical protein